MNGPQIEVHMEQQPFSKLEAVGQKFDWIVRESDMVRRYARALLAVFLTALSVKYIICFVRTGDYYTLYSNKKSRLYFREASKSILAVRDICVGVLISSSIQVLS